MKNKGALCNGNYCSKKEKCQLYIDFLELVKDKKFPRSIESTVCIEPIWQNEKFIKKAFSKFVKIGKKKT